MAAVCEEEGEFVLRAGDGAEDEEFGVVEGCGGANWFWCGWCKWWELACDNAACGWEREWW